MAESDFYPAGAYNDPDAPFNEKIIPLREFDIEAEFTMRKVVTVKTSDYIPEYDDENGRDCPNTENTDWHSAYDDNGHYTIIELLSELEEYVLEDMKTCSPNTGKGRALKRLLENCRGWTMEANFE